MKNLNKALAMVLVVALMISTVAFAASFSDVDDTKSYSEAVNVGVALNLFKGYEDGTFKPEGDITRAEFAAIVVRMLGQEASATGAKTATSFKDVPADNWAAGYVNVATRMGIINGYGDGNFGPDDKVLYEQALKMIVVALGYAPTIGSAGYPVGYITKANELNITNGVNGTSGAAANRGTVAQIVFNAMDVPLMTQSGYGTFIEYIVNDGVGSDKSYKTTLTDYQNVVKLQVTVDDLTRIDGQIKVTPANVSQVNKVKSSKFEDFFTNTVSSVTIKSGTSGIDTMIGQKVTAYISCDSTANVEDSVVLYANKDVSKVTELTVAGSDIEEVVAGTGSNASSIEFSYWANPTDRKAEVIEIVGAGGTTLPTVYKNGEKMSYNNAGSIATALFTSDIPGFYGTVTFSKMNNNSTGDFDTIFISDYKTLVVESVSSNSYRVLPKNATTSISFDPKDTKATLVDAKGTELKWTDLKEWDVVSYQKATISGKDVINGVLVTNTVTGKVEGTSDYVAGKAVYTIGGKEYKLSRDITYTEIAVGDQGTFYLDVLGRIAYYQFDAGVGNSNYAYVVKGAATTSGVEDTSQLKLYTAKGEMLTYDAAQTVKVDGVNVEGKNIYSSTINAKVATKIPQVTASDKLSREQGFGYYFKADDAAVTLNTDTIAKIKAINVGDFVTFEVNSSGKLISIDRPHTSVTKLMAGSQVRFAKYDAVTTPIEYNEGSKSFSGLSGRVFLKSDTVIMVVDPNSTEDDDFDLFTIASLQDEQKFKNVEAFNVDENMNVGAILVKDPDFEVISSTNGFAAVKAISETTNTDGDSIWSISTFRNGAEIAIPSVASYANTTPAIGDIVMPALNPLGAAKDYKIIASPTASATAGADKVDLNFNASTNPFVVSEKTTYYYGVVGKIVGRSIIFVNDVRQTSATSDLGKFGFTKYGIAGNVKVESGTQGAVDTVTIATDANVYIYDERSSSSSNKVTLGELAEFGVRTASAADLAATLNAPNLNVVYDASGAAINRIYAVVREYDGKFADVMLYVFK